MYFFFQAEDGIRDYKVTGVQTCALPISPQTKSRRQSEPPWHRALEETCRMGYAGAVAVRVNPWMILGYQLAPALGAPAREHPAAARGGHARTEPVGALAAHFARLIGTLHAVGSVGRSVARKKGRQG